MLNTLERGKELSKKGEITINISNGVKLYLRKGVFIPDNESLFFIGIIKKFIEGNADKISTIADVGTGSGIIAIYMAKKFPHKKVYGFDISKKAIEVAKHNSSLNKIRNIFLFKNRAGIWIDMPYRNTLDLVVSNPPYVGDTEYFSKCFIKDYPDARYQPIRALRSYDKEGIKPYVEIFDSAKSHKAKYVLFRCNTKTADKIGLLLSRRGCGSIKKLQSRANKSQYLLVHL